MKKKNLKSLMLNKNTVSVLNSDTIKGGTGGWSSRGIICTNSCESRCLCQQTTPGVNCDNNTKPNQGANAPF